MAQGSRPPAHVEQVETSEAFKMRMKLVKHIAACRGATVEHLSTRYGMCEDEVQAVLDAARARGAVEIDKELGEGQEFYVPTQLGYELAGMPDWKSTQVRPGVDTLAKRVPEHIRAVALVGAAIGVQLDAEGTHKGRIESELVMRLKGRNGRKDLPVTGRKVQRRRRYSFELEMKLGDKLRWHCPDFIAYHDDAPDAKAEVIEVLVIERSDEELEWLCKWPRNEAVAKLSFYAAEEQIDRLRMIAGRSPYREQIVIYQLPASGQAKDLVNVDPQSPLIIAAEQTVMTLDDDEKRSLVEMLAWIGTHKIVEVQVVNWKFAKKFTPELLGRLLSMAEQKTLLHIKQLNGASVYQLTKAGEKLAGINDPINLTIGRRNAPHLSRRARIVSMLTHTCPESEVLSPRDLRPRVPFIEAEVNGSRCRYDADLFLRPLIESWGKPIAVILVTSLMSRSGYRAWLQAWDDCQEVAEAYIYATAGILAMLESVVGEMGETKKLKLLAMPSSGDEQAEQVRKRRNLEHLARNLTEHDRRTRTRASLLAETPQFRSLTDQEWEALVPIIGADLDTWAKMWYGVQIQGDREIIDTVLLANQRQRALRGMTIPQGYSNGDTAADRVAEWIACGVWRLVVKKLAELAPDRAFKRDFLVDEWKNNSVEVRGLFAMPDYKATLEGDLEALIELDFSFAPTVSWIDK